MKNTVRRTRLWVAKGDDGKIFQVKVKLGSDQSHKFKVGDLCRIAKEVGIFRIIYFDKDHNVILASRDNACAAPAHIHGMSKLRPLSAIEQLACEGLQV